MDKCIHCGGKLNGRQTKYCSRKCKNTFNNHNYQSYQSQQLRGRKRKLKLIELKGAACSNCGYSKNYSALEFHHINPNIKEFQLDLRSLSNRKWEIILKEVEKCILICSNCHSELHNPECNF
jgi:hypothetical protein